MAKAEQKKPSERKKCYYKHCSSSSDKDNIRFFNFPKNLSNQWVDACNNPCLIDISKNVLLKHRFVCGKHFSRYDFHRFLTPFKGKSRLKDTAVPKDSGRFI